MPELPDVRVFAGRLTSRQEDLAVVAGGLAVGALQLWLYGSGGRGWSGLWTTVPPVLVLAGLVPVRRSRPAAAVVAGAVALAESAALAAVLGAGPPVAAALLYAVVLAGAGRWGGRRLVGNTLLTVCLVVLAVALVAVVRLPLGRAAPAALAAAVALVLPPAWGALRRSRAEAVAGRWTAGVRPGAEVLLPGRSGPSVGEGIAERLADVVRAGRAAEAERAAEAASARLRRAGDGAGRRPTGAVGRPGPGVVAARGRSGAEVEAFAPGAWRALIAESGVAVRVEERGEAVALPGGTALALAAIVHGALAEALRAGASGSGGEPVRLLLDYRPELLVVTVRGPGAAGAARALTAELPFDVVTGSFGDTYDSQA